MSTTYNPADPYAGSRETTEGRVYTVTGGDWDRHPQRKDYPLGVISVEYHDATTPPPDTRRAYR